MKYLNTKVIPQYCFSAFRLFEKGEKHVKRICDEDVIVFVFDGILRFKEDGKEIEVCKNQYYIQKAGLRQEGITASDKPQYFYIHFHGDINDDISGIPISGEFSPEKLKHKFYELECLGSVIDSFLQSTILFLQIIESLKEQYIIKSPQSDIADNILKILTSKSSENITINEISKELSYSPNYIIKTFKQKYFVTPHRYLSKIRVENARKLLLSSGKSCQTISDECGFSEYSVFYKMFKKEYGLSPTEFSARHRIK